MNGHVQLTNLTKVITMNNLTNLINKAQQNNQAVTTKPTEEVTMNELDFASEVKPAVEALVEVQHEEIKLSQLLNVNALSSAISAILFHEFKCTQKAVVTACAIVDAIELSDNMDLPEAFFSLIESTIESSSLKSTVSGNGKIETTVHEVTIESEVLEETLRKLGLMNEDHTVGKKLIDLMERRTEAYAPHVAGSEWERRFPLYAKEKGQISPLAIKAIEVLEKTEGKKDVRMADIANKVQAKLGLDNDDEAYVLAGVNKLEDDVHYCTEFKADSRIRKYQAACHGWNGQASDRSRALMDLAGVPTDYHIPTVKKAIRAEVMDMVKVPENQVGKLMMKAIKDPVQFIIEELTKVKKDRDATKPWSFVKAALIWKDLADGKRPYIGMAVGLDAKCSGPQLGALMVGDQTLAAACGFSTVEIEDAYHRAITELQKAGFDVSMKNRGDVKKPFMGIFYGQSWGAFTSKQAIMDDNDGSTTLFDIIYPDGVISDDVAKRFHKAITKSFGNKLIAVRARFKEYTNKIDKRVAHKMPDGATVVMNYKVKYNILNEAEEYGTVCPDVSVVTENNSYKFIGMAMKSKEIDTSSFVRNGFVNMIQATDALLARLIIVHLDRLGAKHVVSVHDCFRVNVTEMHLLEQAIKNAYMDLFGSKTNIKTEDLPLGTDILNMYFEGANNALKEGESKITPVKQFMTIKGAGEVRKMQAVMGVKLPELIKDLGNTYYFAK
jgi:putative sterol carrier protein